MYPGVKGTDPVHSGTSVFYQAIPDVGADGNNIMKLIPVQMVNRQLVKSWNSQPKADPPPQTAGTTNLASAHVWMAKAKALNPPATKQDKHPLQQENVNLMAIVPPMATPVANSGTPGRRPSQPVTVKTPSLPRGRCHQSPTMAQVQSGLGSGLPAGIKTKTFTSSTNSSLGVTYVSPNTSFSQGVTSQSDSLLDMLTLLCKTSKGPTPNLKLIPQVSQRPNSPIKWSVEEADNPVAPTLDPIDSPVTSQILRVVAERENAGKHCDVITKPGPTFNPINSSVTSEILRVAAERENAVKHHDFLTKPVSGSSPGRSARGQRHPFDISSMTHPLQQENVHLMAIVPPMATPVANSGTSGRRPSQPVTVKTPSLPRGRCHQSPAGAQVQSGPASGLPAGIKSKTFPSSTNSSPGSGLPSAAYASPMASVNQSVTLQSDSVLPTLTLLCETSNTTSCGPPSQGPKPHLKLIPQVSQRPNSPIKWSVEEADNPEAVDPIDSPVTSEILRVVAERENAGKHCDVTKPGLTFNPINSSVTSEILRVAAERENAAKQHEVLTKPVHGSSHGQSARGQRHPFDMSNRMGKSNSPTAARTSYEFNKTSPTSSRQSLESAAPQRKRSLGMLRPQEVIDLCDDEGHSSQRAASLHTSAVAHSDEDNVIFVSYIPPQLESHYLRRKPQMDVVKESDQTGTSSWINVAELKSLDGTADALKRRILGQSTSAATVRTHTHVCGSAVMNTCDNLDSNISRQRSASTRQPESMRVDVESTSPADGIKKGHKMESSMNPTTSGTSSLPPASCQISDHLLRQIFGITADVKIPLRRVDGSIFWSPPAEPPHSESRQSVEDHQEPMNGLKKTEHFSQDLYSPQETASCKCLNEPSAQEVSEASTCPLTSSHFKLENTWCSGNSSLKETWSDVEPVIGYVEPIDEDFLSTDDNSLDKAAGPQTRTCVDLDSNTRRMGRKRKRTMCPCCIPGTRDPRAKSGTEEPEKWAWMTERAGKRGGRAKALSKDVKTSGSSDCLTAQDKQSCKSSEDAAAYGFSAASSDSEVKLHKQIMRLKEQLQEKEAALELMRSGRHVKL